MQNDDPGQLTGLFKRHFTFAIALSAAQRCVSTSPGSIVPYVMATSIFIVVLRTAATHMRAGGALTMLNGEAVQVATQVLSSLLGTWITSMVGEHSSVDQLLAVASLGLVMAWIAGRSMGGA
jgi:hypothetical protein